MHILAVLLRAGLSCVQIVNTGGGGRICLGCTFCAANLARGGPIFGCKSCTVIIRKHPCMPNKRRFFPHLNPLNTQNVADSAVVFCVERTMLKSSKIPPFVTKRLSLMAFLTLAAPLAKLRNTVYWCQKCYPHVVAILQPMRGHFKQQLAPFFFNNN